MPALLSTHSGFRYLVLVLLLLSLFTAYRGLIYQKEYTSGVKCLHFITRILLMIQGLIGIALFVTAGFPPVYFHLIFMLAGIIVCSIGYGVANRAVTDREKYQRIAVFFTVGLVIILAAIPYH